MDVIEKIKEEAKQLSYDSGCHGFDHTERVHELCMHIGKIEGADLEILSYAALLHDIARKIEDESKGTLCHAENGAVLARAILIKYSIPEEKIQKITHCIETHRFRADRVPETIEARVLYDADKLDSIGAIGIARAYVFTGEIGAVVHNPQVDLELTTTYSQDDNGYREYLVKLSKIKSQMLTKVGKEIAEERDLYMKEFFERLNKEIKGKL